jgi:hypothetical protein
MARRCWRRARRHDLTQNFVAWSETLLHAVRKYKEVVTARQCRRTVRNQHNDRSPGLKTNDRLLQSRLALAV